MVSQDQLNILMQKTYETMTYQVYIVGGNTSYLKALRGLRGSLVETLDLVQADVVLFTGGEDVDPSLYGEDRHPLTQSNIMRDRVEAGIFSYCVARKKPMIGICRGAQFLTVMNGGKLVQHVTGHSLGNRRHLIKLGNGLNIQMTSTHHQMMNPFNLKLTDYTILGYSKGISLTYQTGERKEISLPVEPEVVHYRKTKCFAIQGHPERQTEDVVSLSLLGDLIHETILPQ